MTRKLLFGFIAILAMSLWVVGCATDDVEEPTPNEPPEFSNVIGFPAQGAELCAASFTVTGEVDDDSGVAEVILLFDGVELVTFDGEGEAPVVFTFPNVVLPATGTGHTLSLVVDDTDEERTIYLTVLLGPIYQDETAPVITKISPEGDIFIVNGQYLEVEVTDDFDIVEVCLEIDGVDVSCETTDPYRWDLGIWRDDYAPGDHEVVFTAEDYCGNIGDMTYTLDFQFSEYTLTVTSPEVEAVLCGEYTFTAEDSWEVAELFDVESVDFLIDDGEQGTYTDSDGTDGWQYTIDVTHFEGGEHQISARAYFDNGSSQDSENSILWFKSCPPTAVLGFPVVIDGPEFQVMAGACNSSDDNAGALTYHWSSPTEPGVVITPAADTFNCEVLFDFSLGYGVYEICVQVEDEFEMLSEVVCTQVEIIDVTAPTVWEWLSPDSMAVVGDYTLPMTLSVDATDRLTMPEVAQVEFRFLENANAANFGTLCIDTDAADGWACDISTFVEPGGWYTYKAYATDNADPANVSTSLNHPVWKSDKPVVSIVAEEHDDGGYYSNMLAGHTFTAVWTDDNFGDLLTTHEVQWDLDSDGTWETIGNGVPWTAADFGDYTVQVRVVETTPEGCTPATIPGDPYTLSICIENVIPIVDNFTVDFLHFEWNEGPYCSEDYININDPDIPGGVHLVTEDRDNLVITFQAHDDPTSVCESECDYFTIFFDYTGTQYDVTEVIEDCGVEEFDVNWDDSNFVGGQWVVTFTVYDRAGNSASRVETVIKSDFPVVTVPASFDNYFEDEWQCWVDPLGVPVRFNDWDGDDDNGSYIDSLVFEFDWDAGTTPPGSAINCTPDMLEEIWDYHGPGYPLPWTYYVPDYGHHWVRIWACDQYGQWTVSEWVETGVEDHCNPDWLMELAIDEVQDDLGDYPVDPCNNFWERVDIISGEIDFCTALTISDREDPFDDHGIDEIQFKAFNPNDGWEGDLDYWFDRYGVLPLDGSLGDGNSACTGLLAAKNGGNDDCTSNTEDWHADQASWYGCCGFYYVYAIALDNNGNYSAPSCPVILFKYSLPTIDFCDCFVGDVDEVISLSAFYEYECGSSIDSVKYYWVFDDGETAVTTVPNVDHVFTGPGLYEVEVQVTVWDSSAGSPYYDDDMTWVSIGDTDEPEVTNLDIEATDENDNYDNEGFYNAQYGVMNYTVTANDINGILQGPDTHWSPNDEWEPGEEECLGADDWTVEITLYEDDDDLPGGTFAAQITDDPQLPILLVNEDCMENEKTWVFDFNWGDYDCKVDGYVDTYERGYYWMVARVRDRSGNYMGDDTPADPTDDYFALQLFHSDPPGIEVDCVYTNLNTLRFNIRYDCLILCDDAVITPDFKTQWDQTSTFVSCYRWDTGWNNEHPTWGWDHTNYGNASFVFDHEFDWSGTEDNIWLDYFNSGDGYGYYGKEPYSSTSTNNPALVRAVDEDGIYSEVIHFDVEIEDVTEPCIEWQEPDPCDIVWGDIDLVIWASDYPEHDDGRGVMPCISRVDFFANDHYIESDYTFGFGDDCASWDGSTYDGVATLCDIEDSPYFEFSIEDFDISAFLDSIYDMTGPGCGWGGVVELEARAYDVDGNQSGDISMTVCESNLPIITPAGICDWAYNDEIVVVDFTPYICDDNPIDHIVIDWGDGSSTTWADWPASAVMHQYPGVGCYDVEVQVYDYYSIAGNCCDSNAAGPFLDFTSIGSVLVDVAAPIVTTNNWTPELDEACVSIDPPELTERLEIIVGDITDDDSFNCYGEIAIDRVDFWLSDDDWTNKEYLGFDIDGTDGWSVFWNPWNQEAKTIWVGIEIMDCAGNSAEYFMATPGEYFFHKDLRPWDVLIDQHEVWAINRPGCEIPFEAEAHNDPDDYMEFVWDWDDDGIDEDTTDESDPLFWLDLDALGVGAGTYDLVVWAVDDCWDFDDDANTDTAVVHVCQWNEGPDVALTDEFGVFEMPDDPVEGMNFEFCVTVEDCFYWNDGIVSVIANGTTDTLYVFNFQTEHQWNPDWEDCYTYEAPNGPETFCFDFPVGNEDCVWVDINGDTLLYNPFAHGADFDLDIRVWDTEDNETDENNTFTISDVLGPYVNEDGFWYGDDYIFGDDELPLSGAMIPFNYQEGTPDEGNAVISLDIIDWHCTDIFEVVFVFEEPAGNWDFVDMDNVFGQDNDGSDGWSALLNLPTPSGETYRVGVFIWDILGNVSVQQHVDFYVVE